ncbi:MAG: polymer-forming cytoskeletal protein [Actinomycetota bacterium]
MGQRLLVLCAAALALTCLTQAPAQGLEKRVYGTVVVESGEEVEEASAVIGGVAVDGAVEGDVSSGYGDVRVDGPVGGDVNSGFGDVSVRAPVGGDVGASFGDVYVDSRVGGDVDVRRGDLRLGPNAEIHGHVFVGDGSVRAERVAALPGHVEAGTATRLRHVPDGTGSPWLQAWLFATLVFVACCVLAAVALPRPMRAAALRAEQYPGRSLLLGVVSVPVAVILAVVLAVSVVGIPVLLLLSPAYLALLFFGALVAAYFVGRKVLMSTGRHGGGDALAAATGALIVAATYLIPVLGDLALYLFVLLGAGATIIALFSYRRLF